MEPDEMIESKICDLLALGNGVLAVGIIGAALPAFSEAQICCALVRLCEKEVVSIDSAGVHLLGANKDVEAAETTPENDASAADPFAGSLSAAEPSTGSPFAEEERREAEGYEAGESALPPEPSVSSVPQFSAPDTPQFFTPSVPESSAPDALQFFAPSVPQSFDSDTSEAASEWVPEITGETLLLGVDAPRDYSDTYLPEEEIASLVESLGYKSTADAQSRRDAVAPEESEPVASGPVSVGYGSSLKLFGFSERVGNFLKAHGATRLEDLVSISDSLDSIRGCGARGKSEIRRGLSTAAHELPWPVEPSQIELMRSHSGSSEYVFDLFGILCRAQEPSDGSFTGRQEGDLADAADTPVEALQISNATLRLLRANHIDTVGDILRLGEEGLLGLRSFGAKKMQEVMDALEWGQIAPVPQEKVLPSVDAETFKASYSSEALALTEQLEGALVEKGYLVLPIPFLAMVLPLASAQLEEGGSESFAEAFSRLEAFLESSDHLELSCSLQLEKGLRKLQKRARKGALPADLRLEVGAGRPWTESARRLEAREADVSFDEAGGLLVLEAPSLEEWVSTLKDMQRKTLSLKLSGQTLAQCGDALGITRERVRQIVTKALEKRPTLEEDRYRPLFEAYRLDAEKFAAVTGEPGEVYEYLALTARTKKDERAPLETALDDVSLDEPLRERIRSVVDEGFAYVDGRRVPLRRQPVIDALLRRHAADTGISLGELLDFYRGFTREHGMADESVFEGTGPRALAANFDRWDFVMQSGAPKDDDGVRRDIRFYDWKAQDFEPLRDFLRRWSLRDIECSTALLLRDEEGARLAADLGLRDEYELHCAIRRGVGEIMGVRVLKRPMICFGKGDRGRQVLDLIRELGPADAYVLADAYESRYGVKAPTFRGAFLKDFRVYEHDGVYQCVDAGLTDEQRAFLTSALGGRDYVALPSLKEHFSTAFPAAPALIGSAALSQMGYRISGDLAVREGVDEAALFAALIDGKRTFSVNDDGFGPEVFRNEAFRSELNKRIRAFEVVEYLKDSFLNAAALASLGEPVTQDDLRDYASAAREFMEPERPYSVRSLREAGFSHKVSALGPRLPGGGDYFLGSLIATGYVGGRLKLTSMGGVYLFCKKSGSFSAPDLLVFMTQGGPAEEKVLQARLAAEHGIEVSLPSLRTLCQRAGVALTGVASADAAGEADAGAEAQADAGAGARVDAEGGARDAGELGEGGGGPLDGNADF